MKSWLPAGLLGCVHCSVTCLSLLYLIQNWGLDSTTLWKATGYTETAVLIGFYGSWIALVYSLYYAGMGYQTGLTQWWYWLKRQRPPQRVFIEIGPFRWMRHPVYIYLGSHAKDQRMLRFVGDQYREYASRISGLPLIGIGPLLRIKP